MLRVWNRRVSLKEQHKLADPRRLLSIGAVLAAAFVIYLFLVSDWYWTCSAQINPATLAPVKCHALKPVEECVSAQASEAQQTKTVEEQLWPCFGRGNNTFDDLSGFWGDDYLSKFVQLMLSGLVVISRTFVVDHLVPRWNETMVSFFNRSTLFGVLSTLFALWGRAWAKDVYRLLRWPSQNQKAS